MGGACAGGRDDPASLGEELLGDIADIFSKLTIPDKGISSANLTEALLAREDKPWKEANRGRPITQRWLALKLERFKIRTKNIRIGKEVLKGYERAMFEDAFARYCPQSDDLRRGGGVI